MKNLKSLKNKAEFMRKGITFKAVVPIEYNDKLNGACLYPKAYMQSVITKASK